MRDTYFFTQGGLPIVFNQFNYFERFRTHVYTDVSFHINFLSRINIAKAHAGPLRRDLHCKRSNR